MDFLSKKYKLEEFMINKYLGNIIGSNDVLINIKEFLYRNELGFKLFLNKEYKNEKDEILHYNKLGHPLECILRIFSKMNINYKQDLKSLNNVFNVLINDESFDRVDLTNVVNELSKIDYLADCINKPCNVVIFFEHFIKLSTDRYKSLSMNRDVKCSNCNLHKVINNKFYIELTDFNDLKSYLINEFKNIQIKNNRCYRCGKNTCKLITETKIIPKKYLMLYRIIKEENNCNYIIPNKLNIPGDITITNKNVSYNLKSIVVYQTNENKSGYYSFIMNNNNKWYHYSKDNITELTFNKVLEYRKYFSMIMYELV